MKGYLYRAIIQRYWKLLLSMLLVSAFGCATMTGINNGCLSLEKTLNAYMREGGYPHAVITTDVTKRKKMDKLLSLDGIEAVSARLVGDGIMISPEGRYLSARLISFDEDDIQKIYVEDQAEPNGFDPIYLEYFFAKNNGINAGDTVTLLSGTDSRLCFVAGVISRPETLATEVAEEISINNDDFGYAYVLRALLEKEENTEHRNAMLEWEEKSSELSEAEQAAKQDYESAIHQLLEAEANLQENKTEFAAKQKEVEEHLSELAQKREELKAARKELTEKRAEAITNRRNLIANRSEAEAKRTELLQAQADLNEKTAQLTETKQALQEQWNVLAEQREEAEKQLSALEETEKELLAGKEELEKAREEALKKQRELKLGQVELNNKRQEVEKTLSTLRQAKAFLSQLDQGTGIGQAASSAYSQLESAIHEVDAQLASQEAMQRRLQEIQTELGRIDSSLSALEKTAYEAIELLSTRQTIVNGLAALGVQEAGIAGALSAIQADISALRARRGELSSQLSALQDPNAMRQNTDALRAQLNSLLGSVGMGGTLSAPAIDAAIAQAENGLFQIDNALWTIHNGLEQMKTGFDEADEKEAEIDDGLRQIEEGKKTLEDIFSQIDDGFGQMEERFRQISDGFVEMDSYQNQIDDGLSELNEALSQLDEYQDQLNEAFIQIRDGLEEIENGFSQIAESESQLIDGITEAERHISEGEEELKARRTEVEDGWLDAQIQFANGKDELQKAADELAEWEGYQALCNQFLLYFSSDASPDAVLASAQDALKEANVRNAFLFQDSPVKQRIDGNLIPMETMANFIPFFFFGITMIVVYLFMTMMIRQCRREIGILRALGFRRFSVMRLFCGVGLMVSIGAIALGLLISLLVRRYICYYYFDLLFHLPIKNYVFNSQRFLFSAALTVAVVLLSTCLSASSISGIQPSEAMTRPVSSTVKIPGSVQWALRGASPFLKFSVISLLRNKLRFLFSAFCLAGSVMLIFASFSLISSCNEIIRQVFDRCIHYDCQVFVRGGSEGDLSGSLAALPYVSDVEVMDYYTADVSFQGRAEKTTVVAVREQTKLLSVEDQEKRPIPFKTNGIILEKHLAEKLCAGKDDLITVDGVSLAVSAISQQNGGRFQYVTEETASALANQTFHSLIFRIPFEYENELMLFLIEREDVFYTSFTHSAYSAYKTILSGTKIIAMVLVGMAMAIGLVIVVNTSHTNLLEQKKELCVLRTLGFQHSEISRYWFFQSILHFLVSCAFGFPAGIALSKSTIQQLEMTQRTYTFVNNPMDYALTAFFVLCYIVLSHFLTMRALKKWDIVEVVKERE